MIGRWTRESAASAYLYTDIDNFDNGKPGDPIYSAQVNVIYSFKNGVRASPGRTCCTAGKTSIDGVDKNDLLDNTRTGFAVAMPVDRHNSVKIFGSTGVSTRTGTDYDSLGVVWQYRGGAGILYS